MRTPETDFPISTRLKLAFGWTSLQLCYLYGDYFELYVPGKVAGLANGVHNLDSPFRLFLASLVLALPSFQILGCVLLSANWVKRTCIGLGLLMSLFTFLVGLASFSAWRSFYVLLAFAETGLGLFLVSMAWNWNPVPDSGTEQS